LLPRLGGAGAEGRHRVARQFLKVPPHLRGERGFHRVGVSAKLRREPGRDAGGPSDERVAVVPRKLEHGLLDPGLLDQLAAHHARLDFRLIRKRGHAPRPGIDFGLGAIAPPLAGERSGGFRVSHWGHVSTSGRMSHDFIA
jgi:hypothetical protein